MRLKHFSQFNDIDKLEIIADTGLSVAIRKDREYKFELFHVADFYVELKTHVSNDYIVAINPFDFNSELIERYINTIPISKNW